MLKTTNISYKIVAFAGAKIAVASVLAYSLLIMIYAVIRSSATIYKIMPSGERSDILMANGFSIAYSIAVFSLIMALLSSLSGAIAGVFLKKVLQFFNPNFIKRKSIVLICITAFTMLIMMYLLLYALLKNWMTFNYMETFSFWFLMPAVIFLVVYMTGGSKLNTILAKEMCDEKSNNEKMKF